MCEESRGTPEETGGWKWQGEVRACLTPCPWARKLRQAHFLSQTHFSTMNTYCRSEIKDQNRASLNFGTGAWFWGYETQISSLYNKVFFSYHRDIWILLSKFDCNSKIKIWNAIAIYLIFEIITFLLHWQCSTCTVFIMNITISYLVLNRLLCRADFHVTIFSIYKS